MLAFSMTFVAALAVTRIESLSNCDQVDSERVHCPASGVEATCNRKGCHFCPNGKPYRCIEAIVCKRSPVPADNCWGGNKDEEDSQKCRDVYGCSWCASNPDGLRCIKDPAMQSTATTAVPTSLTTTAVLTTSATRSPEGETSSLVSTSDEIPTTVETFTSEATSSIVRGSATSHEPSTAEATPPTESSSSTPSSGATSTTFSETTTALQPVPRNTSMQQTVENTAPVLDCPDGQVPRYKHHNCCIETANSKKVFKSPWPFMGALYEEKVFRCAAALLDEQHAITSSECVRNIQGEISLKFGKVKLDDESDKVQTYSVFGEPVIHHEFHPSFKNNDLALVKLNTTVNETDYISYIKLPGDEKVPLESTCFTLTWEPEVGHLTEREIKITSFSHCAVAYAFTFGVIMKDSELLCARQKTTDDASCTGESGSPTVCQRCSNCEWYLAGIGIANSIRSCNEPSKPVVLNKMSYFEDWVINNGAPAASKEQFQCY